MDIGSHRLAILKGLAGGATFSGVIAGFPVLSLAQEAPSSATLSSPPPLSAYARNPNIEDVALSKDAKKVAFMSQKDDVRIIVVVELATKKSQFFPLGKDKARAIYFASPDHLLLMTTATEKLTYFLGGRMEVSQATVIDLNTRKSKTLFSGSGNYNLITGNVNFYQRDGKYFVTASTYVQEERVHNKLFEFELGSSLRPRMIDVGSYHTHGWILDANGVLVAQESYNPISNIWRIQITVSETDSLKRIWKTLYSGEFKIDLPSLWGLGRDGRSLVISGLVEDEERRFFELDPKGVMTEIVEGKGARYPLFHPVTKKLCGFGFGGDWVRYDYFDPVMKKIAQAAKDTYADFRFKFYEFADDVRKAVIYTEGNTSAGEYYLMDFATGNEIFIDKLYPEIPNEWVVQKQKITYKTADGLEIESFVTLPPQASGVGALKNLPLIVMPHGGPQSRDGLEFDWQAQAFASRGYCVLQPNFRGSSGYGSSFIEAGHGQWGKKMQTDLSDGVRYLAAQGMVDPKRVAICGASYGGYAALAGAAFEPDVYRCAISIAGVSDLKAMLAWEENETGLGSRTVHYWKRYWGDVPLDSISPAKHAKAIKSPVLLIHGKNDTVVPYDQSRIMNKAMKEAGKDVTLIEYNKEDHWQSLAPARLEMITTIMGFLEKHNPAFKV